MKPISTLLLEALIVGILLVVVFIFVSKFTKNTMYAVFASGALFHLLCEATGVNRWYAKTYFRS
jgi:membrane protein CcdC involved in cytochrome C biogenesis